MQDLTDDLADCLFAILLEEADWTRFLERLIAPSRDASAMFLLQSTGGAGPGGTVSIVTGLDRPAVEAYEGHYARINPWLPDYVMSDPSVMPRRDFDVLSRPALHKTEFYNDYLRPLGFNGSAGLKLARRRHEAMLLAVVLSDPDPASATQMALRIGGVRPVLDRMMSFWRARGTRDPLAVGMAEGIGAGLCLWQTEGAVLQTSPGVEELGAELGLFSVSLQGRIQLRQPLLEEAAARMGQRSYDGRRQMSFALPGCRVTLFRASRDAMSDLLCGPTLGLILEPAPGALSPNQEEVLRLRFGLSPAELRVLRCLSEGQSVGEIAAESGRSVETLRSQVKSVLSKTGCSSQLKLVRFLQNL